MLVVTSPVSLSAFRTSFLLSSAQHSATESSKKHNKCFPVTFPITMTTVMMMTRSADHTGQREQIKHCSLSRECAVKKNNNNNNWKKKRKKKKPLHESDSRVSLLLGSSRFLSGCERDRLFIRPRGELYVTGSKPRPHVTYVKPASTRVTFPLATMDVLEQRHQTMARGPNSARSVIIFDP